MNILLQNKKPRKHILLLGSPGMGKSILSHHIAVNWSEIVKQSTVQPEEPHQALGGSSHEQPTECSRKEADFIKNFNILLHIDLSKISENSTLSKVVKEQILVDEIFKSENIQQFTEYITENSQKCLILLDAWDEYNPSFCPKITNIANGNDLSDATILITSRTRESTVLPEHIETQCMIKGFNRKQAQVFIEKILKLSKSTLSGDELVKFVTDHHLWGVFSVPLMLTYLCLLYLTGSTLKDKVTDLFCSIIKLSLGRHKLKKMKKPAADVKVTLNDYQKELSDLGKLAYLGLENNNTRTVFSQEEAVKVAGEAILDVGLLHKVKSDSPLSPSCLFTFGHKSIQEFIAAVYISNDQTAFNKFSTYLNSLIRLYDCQLLVTFICGLNPVFGEQLIQKIKHISDTDTATAAQCPEFSYSGWETDKPGVVDLARRQTTTASDVTPFLVQCCWEMLGSDESAHSSHREGFPYKPVSALPAIKLKPRINMNIINIYNLTQLIQTSKVVFSEGRYVRLYNLSHNKENDKHITALLDHISHNLTNIISLDTTNMKSDIQCKSLPGIFNTSYKVVRMRNVHLQPSDMQEVLHRLPQNLVNLDLYNVTLSGCEASLCEAVTRLISLRRLYLESLSLPGLYQEKLCEAVTGLTQLQKLSLSDTDMSAAGEALHTCLTALSLLTSLSLADTQLTEDMTRAVVDLLPSWPGLLYLSLDSLPVRAAVGGLTQLLPQLTKLRWLNVSNGGLDSQQLVEVFSSLPQSVQAVWAVGNDTQDDIISITQKLPSLPNLKYVFLSLYRVSADITQQLKAAFQQTGAVIISSDQEYIQHAAGINRIYHDIVNRD